MQDAARDPQGSSREAILSAALEAFHGHGYGSTTVSDIRRAARVSTGSLYHHFAGKEHIAAALFAEGTAAYQAKFLQTLTGEADAERGIRAGVCVHVRWARRNKPLSRFLLGVLDADVAAVTTEEVAQRSRAFVHDVHRWLDAQVRIGAVRALPKELYYPVWIGPAQEFLRQWMRGRAHTPAGEIEARLSDVAWAALRA
jgi:AcrR family transcriptional regulator